MSQTVTLQGAVNRFAIWQFPTDSSSLAVCTVHCLPTVFLQMQPQKRSWQKLLYSSTSNVLR